MFARSCLDTDWLGLSAIFLGNKAVFACCMLNLSFLPLQAGHIANTGSLLALGGQSSVSFGRVTSDVAVYAASGRVNGANTLRLRGHRTFLTGEYNSSRDALCPLHGDAEACDSFFVMLDQCRPEWSIPMTGLLDVFLQI